MEYKQLKDPTTQLTDEFLSMVLGDSFAAWKSFNENLPSFDVSLEWRYYKDGGWLAKCTHKKKTIIWGAASDRFFSLNFIFSEKPHLRAGIQGLDISDDVKNSITSTPQGTFFSITIDVYGENQLSDVYRLIDYKKYAK
jgi:hypothetical protein